MTPHKESNRHPMKTSRLASRPLSSRCLYHFKSDPVIVEKILQHGFSHRLLRETIPFSDSSQMNFGVCFCDIRWEDSGLHQDCYGRNAIVLTKAWGISRGVSPVRYVHEASPGAVGPYLALKNMARFIQAASEGDPSSLVHAWLVTSLLKDEGRIPAVDIATAFATDTSLQGRESAIDDEVATMLGALASSGKQQSALRFLTSLVSRIAELHNELELRDSFTRRYQEDFPCPADGALRSRKVLYDEREWRSIKYALDSASTTLAMSAGFLPANQNLTFTDDDVVAVVAQDQLAKDAYRRFIQNGTALVSSSFDRVYAAAEFDESAC